MSDTALWTNPETFTRIMDDRHNVPILFVTVGTSRNNSLTGGLGGHIVGRYGKTAGAWTWASGGQQNNLGDSTYGWGMSGGIPAATGLAVTAYADASLAQYTNWNFWNSPAFTIKPLYAAGAISGFGGASSFTAYKARIDTTDMEHVMVGKTFTDSAGSIAWRYTQNGSQVNKDYTLTIPQTSAVETYYARQALTQGNANNGTIYAQNSGSTGKLFLLGHALRAKSQRNGIACVSLAHGGGLNQRHVLDELQWIVGQDTIKASFETLPRAIFPDAPKCRIFLVMEYGVNTATYPTPPSSDIISINASDFESYVTGLGYTHTALEGMEGTFLDPEFVKQGLLWDSNGGFPNYLLTSMTANGGFPRIGQYKSALTSGNVSRATGLASRVLVRVASATANNDVDAAYTRPMRTLFDKLTAAAESAGHEAYALISQGTVYPGNETLTADRVSRLRAEFGGDGNAMVVDMTENLISAAALLAIDPTGTDPVHPTTTQFKAVFDAASTAAYLVRPSRRLISPGLAPLTTRETTDDMTILVEDLEQFTPTDRGNLTDIETKVDAIDAEDEPVYTAAVNHDYGGANALSAIFAATPVVGARISVYSQTTGLVVGNTVSIAAGHWTDTMNLPVGAYLVTYSKAGMTNWQRSFSVVEA